MDTSGVLDVAQVASASERAYQHVKAQILSRHYQPQTLLSEGELAAEVGVSRTPVREALLRLQSEGLLRLLPKRGALVLPVTADETADVMETRRLIETFAVRKATATGGPDLIVRLAGHVQAMRDAARERDAAAYVAADREFHNEIVAATGNEIIAGIYRSLRDRQLRMGTVNLVDATGATRVDPARMRDMIADHDAILKAIAARTLRAAERAVLAHLEHAEHLLAGRRP